LEAFAEFVQKQGGKNAQKNTQKQGGFVAAGRQASESLTKETGHQHFSRY
jgi:hypothetical protein